MDGTTRIVALGGLGEVGKNMTVYECDGSIVVVDAGLAFPRDEHLGVDLVLPDFSYLRDRAPSARAVPHLLRADGALDSRLRRHRARDSGRANRPHGRLQARPHARR